MVKVVKAMWVGVAESEATTVRRRGWREVAAMKA